MSRCGLSFFPKKKKKFSLIIQITVMFLAFQLSWRKEEKRKGSRGEGSEGTHQVNGRAKIWIQMYSHHKIQMTNDQYYQQFSQAGGIRRGQSHGQHEGIWRTVADVKMETGWSAYCPLLCLFHTLLSLFSPRVPTPFLPIIAGLQSVTQIPFLYKWFHIILHIQKALKKYLLLKFISLESKACTLRRDNSSLIFTT